LDAGNQNAQSAVLDGIAVNERVQSLQRQGIGSDTLFWRADAALQRALTFLEQRQLPSGEFPVQISADRSMVTGCTPDPSVFPTALIAHCLCFAAPAARLRERALRFLAGQVDQHGLWRHWTAQHPHYRGLPPDLDDTACASAVLSHAGCHIDNRELMLANRNQRGLFLTWVAPRPAFTTAAHLKVTLAQLRHAPTLPLFFKHTSAALYDVDAVVNANCLFYLNDFSGRQLVIDHLLGILEAAAETVCDKWYENPFVIWYFFSRALQGKAPRAGSIIERSAASCIGIAPPQTLPLSACSPRSSRAAPGRARRSTMAAGHAGAMAVSKRRIRTRRIGDRKSSRPPSA
jgi:hypothetical protein